MWEAELLVPDQEGMNEGVENKGMRIKSITNFNQGEGRFFVYATLIS
jgi:hypothetical protein